MAGPIKFFTQGTQVELLQDDAALRTYSQSVQVEVEQSTAVQRVYTQSVQVEVSDPDQLMRFYTMCIQVEVEIVANQLDWPQPQGEALGRARGFIGQRRTRKGQWRQW